MALIKKYPLDKTATAPSNLIDGEQRQVGVQYNRIIAPEVGPYYEDSMVVTDLAGNELIKGSQWTPLIPYVQASMELNKPVSNMILVKDKSITDVKLRYQVPGGLYQNYRDAIIDLIGALMQNTTGIWWDDIGGKPVAFKPTAHLHHLKDIYGFEYEILALEEIKNAIMEGDVAAHEVIYQYIDTLREWVETQVAKLEAADAALGKRIDAISLRVDALETAIRQVQLNLNAHIADKNNPHGTTKAQVGLGLVENYAVATNAQAIAGTATNLYITPVNIKAYVDANVIPVINTHIADKNNPHNTTKSQVGLGNVENYLIASTQEAIAAVATNRYLVPAHLSAYAQNYIIPILNTHVSDKNNPHGTTKSQVGLGNVENYGVATNAESVAGIVTNKFTTPESMTLFRNGYQTISNEPPSTTVGFRPGHIWYETLEV